MIKADSSPKRKITSMTNPNIYKYIPLNHLILGILLVKPEIGQKYLAFCPH